VGRFAIGILILIAELELERITESWSTAVTEAVKRRVHISARAPAGYRRAQRRRFSRLASWEDVTPIRLVRDGLTPLRPGDRAGRAGR
jgi:hypothetical protein